jgi:ADP-L-glycero-D-manno-heptose 6-epimerase
MTRVMLTGHAGFIGRAILKRCQEEGFDIFLVEADIFDSEMWDLELSQSLDEFHPDAVIHVGASSSTLEERVNFTFERNFMCTSIISNWCLQNSSKLVYSSSAASYGQNGRFPSNLYGWSKFSAERVVVANKQVALRYFNVYGPGEDDKGKMSSVLLQAFIDYRNGRKPMLFPGNPRRDFVYIEDVVSANLHALENYEHSKGSYFDVGSGEARSFEEFLTLAKIEFEYLEANKIPNGYQFFTVADKKNFLLNWKPTYQIEDGVAAYMDYLSEEYER